MSRPPDENTARIRVASIRHHLEWGEVDKAREEAAKALQRGEPMVEELRDAIVAALAPVDRQRGRPKAPYPRHWFSIGMTYRTLTQTHGLGADEAYERIAGMRQYGNISAETVRKRVQYFMRQEPGIWSDLQLQAQSKAGS